MRNLFIGFAAGIVATIAGAYFAGAHQAPAMFAAGAGTVVLAAAIAIGSRRRMQAASRFLNAFAAGLSAAPAPLPKKAEPIEAPAPAPPPAPPDPREADLTSALVYLKAKAPAAAAIARTVCAENPGANINELLRIATRRAAA